MTVTRLRQNGVRPSEYLEADQLASLEQLIAESKYREPTDWAEIVKIAGVVAIGVAMIWLALAVRTGGIW